MEYYNKQLLNKTMAKTTTTENKIKILSFFFGTLMLIFTISAALSM